MFWDDFYAYSTLVFISKSLSGFKEARHTFREHAWCRKPDDSNL